MRVCGVWGPLLNLWKHEEPQARMHAAWVAGTAVQNNPKAADHFEACNGLDALKAINTEQDPKVLEKLLLVVSSLGDLSLNWTIKLLDIYKICEQLLVQRHSILSKNGFCRLLRLFTAAIPRVQFFEHSGVVAELLSKYSDCEDEDLLLTVLR